MAKTPLQIEIKIKGNVVYSGVVDEQSNFNADLDELRNNIELLSQSESVSLQDILDAIDKLIDAFRVFNYLLT